MTLEGIVQNGMIVLPKGATLPEGHGCGLLPSRPCNRRAMRRSC
jgi:hypothetical protein